MEIINELAEKYAAQITGDEDTLRKKVYDETLKNHSHNNLMSSFVQGKFLSFISLMIRPKFILEIGTFTGFSALCLSEGLQDGGQLHSIELREEDAKIAKTNFTSSKKNNQIHLHVGNAKEIIPKLNVTWDLVFIDADKTGYTEYYELIMPRLNDNGFILADNVLFHGEVLEEKISGKNAKAINDFNNHVLNDNKTEQVLLTIRDGLMLIKKK